MKGQIVRSVLGVLAIAGLLTVSGCARNDEPRLTTIPANATTGSSTGATPTTTQPTPSTTPPVAGTSTTATSAQDWEVTVENGKVVGGLLDVQVDLGSEVEIVVFSDSTDEVHVHGYDLFFKVTTDESLRIRFDADIPGIFEIEMEGARLLIVELEVS